MLGAATLPADDFEFGDDIGEEPSWEDVTRLADALEYATGQRFGSTRGDIDATDQQLAQLVQRLDAKGYDALWQWRRNWRLNEAFRRGEFTAYWNNVTRALDYDNIGPRVHAPIYGPTLDVLEARLNATKPEMVVSPRSTDQSSIDRAHAASRAAKSQYQDMDVDSARTEMVHKLLLKGTCFVKLVWDHQGGRYLGKTTIPLRDEETGELVPLTDTDPFSPTFGAILRDEAGIPEWDVERDVDGEPIEVADYEGCNVLSVLDPESVLVDPTVTRWRDRMWAIHRYYESPASIEKRLGFKGIHPDGKEQEEAPSQQGMGQRPGRKSRNSESQTALVRELYIQRGDFPWSDDDKDAPVSLETGYIIVECQGQIKKMPNEYGDGPLYMRKASVGDEQLHGGCVADNLRGIQATMTKGLDVWDAANAFYGTPRLFWPAGAGTPDEEKVGTPGAIIHVEGLSERDRPYILDGKSISPGTEQFFSIVFNDLLGYISGVREGGLAGGVPPNVEAAQALRILGERDATRLATVSLNYGLLLQDILKGTIWNTKTFARGPRLYALIGNDMGVEVEEFAGSDIDDDLMYSIIPESIRPQSDEVRRASALQLFQMGLASAADTRERLGENDGEDYLLEKRLRQQTKRESRQAVKEHRIVTPLQIMQWEDHEFAINAHKLSIFDAKAEMDPVAQAIEIQHMQIHAWFLGGMMAPFPGDPMLLQGFIPASMFMGGGPPTPGAPQPGAGGPPGQGGMPPNNQPTQVGLADMEPGAPPDQIQ